MKLLNVVLLCPLAFAQTHWDAPRVVTRICSGCHGIDGNTGRPEFPRLAGLNAEYIGKRLAAFRAAYPPPVDEVIHWFLVPTPPKPVPNVAEARVNMIGIAHSITTDQAGAAAAWFAVRKRSPGRSADPALIAKGRLLFQNGMPGQGVPACQTCHGAEAQGNGTAPRIARQNSVYVLHQLGKFKAGDPKNAPEMTKVARDVNIDQFRALAAFLQSPDEKANRSQTAAEQ